MGRLRLHANVAKFQRLPLNKTQYVKGANGGYKFSGGVPSNSKGFSVDQPSYVEYDYSLALKGKVSDFGLLTNLKMVLIKEGFDNFNLKYLGGFWVLIEFRMKEALENIKSHVGVGVPMKMWTSNTFNKFLSKWGELLFEEDKENLSLYSKRICIKTKLQQNIFKTFKIIVKGKKNWIRAKEVSRWVPDFLEEEEGEDESNDDKDDNEFVRDKNEDELQAHSDNDYDIDVVPETKFSQSHETSKQGNETRFEEGEIHSEDPFKIYDLLQKKPCSNNKEDENSNATFKYPPGFTPVDDLSNKDDQDVFVNVEEQAPKQLINAQGNVNEDNCNRGVSQSKEEDKNLIVQVILDAQQALKQHNSTISDYFVAIQGDWIPNAKRYLIISVYAPQEFSEDRMLWSYLNHVIDSWSGETTIMGDFNEVWSKEERFGTIFNNHNASVFNAFISSGGLVEVPLGGCAFTWCHKSGNKMSKLDRFLISEDLMGSCPNITAITLDQYLSDHRHILLRE
ncbi:RNA-directed DNA polymerase, eukaryota [Tanacetum coccineum]